MNKIHWVVVNREDTPEDVSEGAVARLEGPTSPRGTLHVVATPIGNRDDITVRALRVLSQVRLVVAEDTRHTGLLLHLLGIRVPLLSYHAHNRRSRLARILGELALGDVALVSDAGTPAVSDPGQELVAAAWEAGFRVEAVPGPSSPMAAFMVSGIVADTVHFVGFLPRRSTERTVTLQAMRSWPGAIVCFEAPHRLVVSLRNVHAVLGDRMVAVCNDLTKKFETVARGTLSEIVASFELVEPRGEFTVVIAPERRGARPETLDAEVARRRLDDLMSDGTSRLDALRLLARESGVPRKSLYSMLTDGFGVSD